MVEWSVSLKPNTRQDVLVVEYQQACPRGALVSADDPRDVPVTSACQVPIIVLYSRTHVDGNLCRNDVADILLVGYVCPGMRMYATDVILGSIFP